MIDAYHRVNAKTPPFNTCTIHSPTEFELSFLPLHLQAGTPRAALPRQRPAWQPDCSNWICPKTIYHQGIVAVNACVGAQGYAQQGLVQEIFRTSVRCAQELPASLQEPCDRSCEDYLPPDV